jgi:RNA polymerase sigma-70 factor, ECF subfamily
MGPKNRVVTLEHSSRSVPRDAAHSDEGRDGPGRTADALGPRGAASPIEGPLPPPKAIDFAQVYEAHFDFVWRSLRLMGVPAEAVEDVVQDTFDIVSRQLAAFEGRSSLRTWLFSIAQRVAANHRRMVRRKLSRLEPLSDSAPSTEPTPHAHAEALEAALVVERFVEGLDADWRAVFVLSVLEGVPAAEVADAVGISVNTVYTRVHTLRDALRRAFEQRALRRGSRGLTG